MATQYKAKSWISRYTADEEKNKWKEHRIKAEEGQKRRESLGIQRLEQIPEYTPPTETQTPDVLGGKSITDLTIDERMSKFWNQKEFEKNVDDAFKYNSKSNFYKEMLSRYDMPDFTKTIKMTKNKKPLNLLEQVKSTDGKSVVDKLNPLFVKLGLVDVKKKVYVYKVTDNVLRYNIETNTKDASGYTVITTPREYDIVGENKDNYYYVNNDGTLASLSKSEATEYLPNSKELELLWKQQMNKMVSDIRGSTYEEDKAMADEIKTYGDENILEDIRILDENGVQYNENWSPVKLRKLADKERQKNPVQKFLERSTKGFTGVAAGQGLSENRPDVGNLPANIAADLVNYGLGLATPIPGTPVMGAGSIGGLANLGAKKVLGTQTAARIGGKLGSLAKYFKTPAAERLLASPITKGAVKGVAEGALTGLPVSAYEAASQNLSPGEALKKAGVETAVGAGLGGVLGGVGEGVSKALTTRKVKKAGSKIGGKVEEIQAKKKEAEAKKKEELKKSKFSMETYSKKYGLNEDLSNKPIEEVKKVEKEKVEKVLKDVGKEVKKKVGSNEPEKIIEYYNKKYGTDIKLKDSLRAENAYGRSDLDNVIIKYNPKKDPDIIAGTIRHEVEHIIDKKGGFKGIEKSEKIKAKTLYEKYGQKGHHKNYGFFEPEYIRRQDVKRALDAGENVPKPILKELGLENYTPKPPSNISTTEGIKGPENVSRFKGVTATEGQGTTEGFRKKLRADEPTTYNVASNKEDWSQAVEKVNKNPEETWSKVKAKTENKSGNDITSKDMADMMALAKYHQMNKNYDAFSDVMDHITKVGTNAGQRIQILSLWNRTTPEGMLRYAESKINRNVERKAPKYVEKRTQLKQEIQTLRDAIEKQKNKGENTELNLKILSGKEKDLEAIQKKISNKVGELEEADKIYIDKRMNNYQSQAFWDKEYRDALNKYTKNGSKPITEKLKYKAREAADRYKNIELKRALTRIAEIENRGNTRAKFRAIQRINLLTNAKTSLRNNVSNTIFGLTELARENTLAPILDYGVAAIRERAPIQAFTKKKGRTTLFMPLSKLRAYTKGGAKGLSDLAMDVKDSILKYNEYINTADTQGPFEIKQGRAFKGTNVLSSFGNKVDNLVKTLVTDRPFYEAAKNTRLEELKRIEFKQSGMKRSQWKEFRKSKPSQEMLDNASLYALDKVFQNDSVISKKMTALRKNFLLMDIAMPFTQTPGNILDKLVDYSPFAIRKLLHQLGTAGKKGFDSKLFVDRLSRMFTGTGIAAIGYVLADKGIITGNIYADPSRKSREYRLAKGEKSYSVKVGDRYYSYAWLTPVGGLLAAMADTNSVFKRGFSGEAATSIVLDILGSPLQTIASQSMMSGIINLFSEGTLTEGVAKSLVSGTSQLVPFSTLTRQVATYMDPYDRQITGENPIIKGLKSTQKGIPKYREQLEPKVDIFGNELSYKTGETNIDIFNTFFNPTNMGKVKITSITKELDKIIEKNPDKKSTDILPSIVSDSIRLSGNEYELTDKQYTAFKRIYGRTVTNNLNSLFNDDKYKEADNEVKYDLIKDSYSKSLEEAKKAALKAFGIKIENDKKK